ncbi:hypothetical protein HHI36_016948 [Cryptolaemus montrouzieri]|uniref:Uncharacterized protein n=1 Tax=Cryptolaemus montrouzieri TaxID=559131 RepID=A0ABD2NLX1_9CUCU
MNFFRKFKASIDLKNHPKKHRRQKGEVEVQCLKYKIISEFTEEQVFSTKTNPLKLQDPFISQQPNDNKKIYGKQLIKSEQTITHNPTRDCRKFYNNEETDEKDKYRSTNIDTDFSEEEDDGNSSSKISDEKQVFDDQQGMNTAQLVSKNSVRIHGIDNEESTYEPFEYVDDVLNETEQDIVYFDQMELDEEPYEIHRILHGDHEKNSTSSDNEYDQPKYKDYLNPQTDTRKNTHYNASTHPILNPTLSTTANETNLNTFGNTQKLQYATNYSSHAASIFFDFEEDDGEPNTSYSSKIIFDDVSEVSA